MKQNKLVYAVSSALVILTIAALGILPMTTGCKTLPSGQITFDLPTAGRDLTLASKIGAYYAMQKDAKTRPIFQAVTSGLDLLISNNTVAASALEATILPLVGTNANAQLAVMAGIGLYEANFADAVAYGIASNQVVATLLPALNSGFKQALTLPMGQKAYSLKR